MRKKIDMIKNIFTWQLYIFSLNIFVVKINYNEDIWIKKIIN